MLVKKWMFLLLGALYLTQVFPFVILVQIVRGVSRNSIICVIVAFFVFVALSIVLVVINIVSAVISLKRNPECEARKPFKAVLLFKLGLVPFFIIHFLLWGISMGGTANPFLLALWALLPFIFISYAYLVLLSTSSYSVMQIIKIYRNGTLTKKKCAFHIIGYRAAFT